LETVATVVPFTVIVAYPMGALSLALVIVPLTLV